MSKAQATLDSFFCKKRPAADGSEGGGAGAPPAVKRTKTTAITDHSAQTCAICGAPPDKVRYQGVVVCRGCTGFFQEAAARDDKSTCAFDGKCVITKEARKRCAPCRLRKCEMAGLRKTAIKFKISLEERRKSSVLRQARYKKTAKGKAVDKKYQQGPAGLATLKRYRTSEHGSQKIRMYRFQQLHPEGDEVHMPPRLQPRDLNAPVPKQLVDVVTGTKEKPISREKLFPGIYIGSSVDKRAVNHASDVSRAMDTNTVTELINGAKCETIESIFENGDYCDHSRQYGDVHNVHDLRGAP